MQNDEFIENVDLIMDEVEKPIDKALFIISNVYYCIRNFYSDKHIESISQQFPEYLELFKKKCCKKTITNNFTFNLLDKFSSDNPLDSILEINTNDNSKEVKANEIYYDLLYKKLINIINEENDYNQEEYIESTISLRNCFIFLEYLYLFLKDNPDKISSYIIKIDISLLLDILQRISRRLINSNEFFYLNLIELKGAFAEIKYSPSSFIMKIDQIFRFKYLESLNPIKRKKLFSLEKQLSYLLKTLNKLNNNESSILYDYLSEKLKNLSNDLKSLSLNFDEMIDKYISNTKKCEKKNLNQILYEIQKNNDVQLNFDYLYLIALNKYKDLLENNENKNFQIENDNKNINAVVINETKSNVEKDFGGIKENDDIVEQQVYDIINDEKKALIEKEELILEIKPITPNILGLIYEEIHKYEDKYSEFIETNFIEDRVLKLDNDNIYNILIFNENYQQMEGSNIVNRDNIFIKQKNNLVSSIEDLNPMDYKQFYDIISSPKFHDEIITILKSKPIVEYLTKNRNFEEVKENDLNKEKKKYEFSFPKEGEPYVENFSKEYQKLMEKLSDSLFFINLFRLKYLPFGVKAFVNYNLKIIVNSLYYKFNKHIKENNKIFIFKAALKILIIHEIMHILKYLKNEVNFNDMPKTPREREAGKMLINYLFGIPTIKSINLDEAKKINDIKNWNDINLLKKIFINENQPIENKSFVKKVDCLDLYFTEDDNEDESIKKVKIYEDIGIDID